MQKCHPRFAIIGAWIFHWGTNLPSIRFNSVSHYLTMRSSVLIALVIAVCLGSKVNYPAMFHKALPFHAKSTPVRNPFAEEAMSTCFRWLLT